MAAATGAPLPSEGPISFGAIRSALNGPPAGTPSPMSLYWGATNGMPTSGPLSFSHFRGRAPLRSEGVGVVVSPGLSCQGPDRVGHASGPGRDYHQAVEAIDELLGLYLPEWLKTHHVVITADHGIDRHRSHGGTGKALRHVPLYFLPSGSGSSRPPPPPPPDPVDVPLEAVAGIVIGPPAPPPTPTCPSRPFATSTPTSSGRHAARLHVLQPPLRRRGVLGAPREALPAPPYCEAHALPPPCAACGVPVSLRAPTRRLALAVSFVGGGGGPGRVAALLACSLGVSRASSLFLTRPPARTFWRALSVARAAGDGAPVLLPGGLHHLSTTQVPHCMNCRKEWSPEFLDTVTTKAFREGPLKQKRLTVSATSYFRVPFFLFPPFFVTDGFVPVSSSSSASASTPPAAAAPASTPTAPTAAAVAAVTGSPASAAAATMDAAISSPSGPAISRSTRVRTSSANPLESSFPMAAGPGRPPESAVAISGEAAGGSGAAAGGAAARRGRRVDGRRRRQRWRPAGAGRGRLDGGGASATTTTAATKKGTVSVVF
eukprot:tig00000681_g3096.t1